MNIDIREIFGEKKDKWLSDAIEEKKEADEEPEAVADEPEEAAAETEEPEIVEETEPADGSEELEEPAAEADEEPEELEAVDGPEEPEETAAEAGEEPEIVQDVSEDVPDERLSFRQKAAAFTSDIKEKHGRYGWIAGIALSFALLLFVTFAYTSLVPREVHATINGNEYSVVTTEYTIDDFLESEDIEYCEKDYISRPVSTYIYDGISFKLKHATDIKITADGKTKDHKTLKRTVGEALTDCGIKVGEKDIITPSADAMIGDGMEIIVQRVTTKKETVEEKVPFETVKKDDSSLAEGQTKVITEGRDGLDKVVYEITYIDGVESARNELSRTTITAAVDKVIANGTRINYNGKTYSRKLVVKAYAYTGGGRTAMGTRARVGEIAVDPSVIPLGTRVYIEGVGARRAEDTGGNIKGNTIDIYMNTQSECIRWGVRYVTIYIE